MVINTRINKGYKQTELGVIPEDWEVTPLAGLAIILHGYGFQSKYFKPFGKYRLTTPGHFYETGGFRDVGEKQKYYAGPLPEGYLLYKGDLIVAMTEQADGLLGSAAIVPVSDTFLHNQRLGKVKVLSPELSIRFLYRVFNSKNYRAKVRETAAGTKVKHTSPSKLLEIPILLPPTKAEQEAISNVLSDTDALIEQLEELIDKKKAIKQGAMQELLTGKKRLPGFTGEWEVKKLGEVAKFYKGKGLPKSEITTNGKYKCIHYGELFTTYHEEIKEILSYTNIKDNFFLSHTNDVLMPTSDVTPNGLATASCVKEDDVILGGDILVIRSFDSALDGVFLSYSIRQNKKQIMRLVSGLTVYHLYGSDMKKCELKIPPTIEEQTGIATILSDMDAEIEILELKRDKYTMLKQGMMQQLLTGRIRINAND